MAERNPFQPDDVPGYVFVGNHKPYHPETRENWSEEQMSALVASDLGIPVEAVLTLRGVVANDPTLCSSFVESRFSAIVSAYDKERQETADRIADMMQALIRSPLGSLLDRIFPPCEDPTCPACVARRKAQEEEDR